MGKYRSLGNSFDRTYRNDLNANFDDIDKDIKSQKTRVDNLIQNAPQPSEVVDIRQGVDGVVHPTAKERIDTEVNSINAQLAQIVLNVQTFGAKGDGIANDTSAINSAINEAHSLGGGVVYLPTGTYLVYSRLDLKSNVILRGNGKTNTVIKKAVTHSHSDIILIRDIETNVVIEGIHIDGVKEDGNAVTNKGVNIQGHKVIIQDCKFTNIKTNDAIYIGTSSVKSSDIVIRDSEFDNIDRHAVAAIHSKNVVIDGNTIKNCGLYAIDFEPNSPTTQTNEDFTISNNDIENTAQHGIVVTVKARNGKIKWNTLKNIGGEGFIVAYDSTDIVIENNTLDTATDTGISVRLGASKVRVTGNTIKNLGRHGVRVGVSADDVVNHVIIENNTIVDPNRASAGYDYIRTETLTTRCLISGNDCYSEKGTLLPSYGVNLLGTKHRVMGNNFDDYVASNGIYIGSADNFISGNYEKGEIKKPIYLNKYRMNENGEVPQDAVSNLTLLNSWVNYGAPKRTATYFKDKFGLVHVDGVIKNGTITDGTVLFNLPEGYRPPSDLNFLGVANSSENVFTYKLVVKSNGDVTIQFLRTATEVSISIPPFRV